MTAYIILFICTTILVQLAGSRNQGSTAVRWVIGAIVVTYTSLIAAVRDFGVGGPDVFVYGNTIFLAASQSTSFGEMNSILTNARIDSEVGYNLFNYVVSRFTDDPRVFYFWLSVFTTTIVLVAIMAMRRYAAPALMWLTFLCTAYVDTFNLLRQAPALALALLGFVIVLHQRKWWGLAVGASGILFHTSAIAFLGIWVITVYLQSGGAVPSRKRILAVIAGATAVLVFGSVILESVGVLLADTKYNYYLTVDLRGGNAVGVEVLYRLVPIVAGLAVVASLKRQSDALPRLPDPALLDVSRTGLTTMTRTRPTATSGELDTRRRIVIVLVVMLTIELLLIPLREISRPLYRIPMYFGYLRIIAYAVIASNVRTNKPLAQVAVVGFVVAYFFLLVIQQADGEYASAILDGLF